MEPTQSADHYSLLKIILDFMGTVAWPLTVLIIVFIYRESILRLINRAKKVDLPGGFTVETMDEEIKQAKDLAVEIKTERKPLRQEFINKVPKKSESELNKRMIELGLTPSPSGLDLNYYKIIADADPRLALIGLRSDFELMLRNLAKGFKIQVDSKEPVSKIISKLFEKGAITSKQYEFITTIFKISNSAAHGASISKEQAYEVLDVGRVLIDDYIAWLDWGFSK